jgi:ribosomal protein RSM22 (predicted rRNA methylase)
VKSAKSVPKNKLTRVTPTTQNLKLRTAARGGKKMAKVIVNEQTAHNLKRLIEAAVENQVRILTFGVAKTNRKLEEMEKETRIDSKAFYRQFQEGKWGDEIKYIRWAGEHETLERLKRDLGELQELELCS